MVEAETCPRCGGTVTAGSLEGLCARCLLSAALSGPAEGATHLPAAGHRVAAWRIVRLLGEGGMGMVYLAEQEEPVARQAALKVIGAGVLHPKTLQRFLDERHILGELDHPNIARLLDGGVTEDGVPYMAMEYVDGLPITGHCARGNLSIRRRLELLRAVCLAVHYAHQHLVVHRDIKPANILVTANGVPSLLDFGIAKMLDPLHAASGPTGTLLRPMTPDYASPEQLRGAPVTTATDIYSLGVVLYELLTGARPYRLAHLPLDEAIRTVSESAPRKPSAEPDAVARGLSDDLDSIVLKAMRKEAQERYASARELADDLTRYLDGLPVLARRGTFGYLARKLLARHKAHGAAIAAGLVLLAIGSTAVGWEAHVANRERAKAQRRFEDLRGLARSMIFELHDGIARLAGSTEVRKKLVTRALAYLDSLARDSSDDVGLLTELAAAYRRVGDVQGRPNQANVGDLEGALASYGKGLAAIGQALKRSPRDDAALREEGWLHLVIGEIYIARNDNSSARGSVEQGLKLLRGRVDGPGAPTGRRADLAAALLDMFLAVRPIDAAAARDYLNQAADVYEKILSDDPESASSRNNVALAHRYLATYADNESAKRHLRRSLELDRMCVSADPSNADARLNVAVDLSELGRHEYAGGDLRAALAHHRESLAIRQELAAADPASVLARRRLALGYLMVAGALLGTGDAAAAVEQGRKSAPIYQEFLRANPGDQEALRRLAEVYAAIGEAEGRLGHPREACSAFHSGAGTLALPAASGSSDTWITRIRGRISRGLARCVSP